MKQLTPSARYLATAALRQLIDEQGRRDDWIAQKAGLSKSHFSKIVSRKLTIPETDARILAALLHAEFDVLFELPESAKFALVDSQAAAV